MNILLINHYAGSPYHGMEFRPYYLAREWVRRGHKVQIVAASYSHIRSVQPDLGRLPRKDEIIDGIGYCWYKTPTYFGNGIGRVRSMISFLARLYRDGRRLALGFSPDIVIASSTYPMDIWPACRIARISHATLIYEVHDLWPLSPKELGGMPWWHPFILWVQRAEDYAYRHADKVVSLLPDALPYMRSHGLFPQKFFYVPNGVNQEEWDQPEAISSEIAAQLNRLRQNGPPIVAYVGTHGLANALDVLLDASRLLKGEAQILLVGPGPERNRLAARVEREHLSNVLMLPPVPKRAVPSLLAEVDIAYIGLRPTPLFRFGISPNKLLDYMMSAKPIILAVDARNHPVAEAGCGISVPSGDPEAVAAAILRLVKMPKRDLDAMGTSGRRFVLENQTYSVLAERFLRAMVGAEGMPYDG